jgi:hypothetical protein
MFKIYRYVEDENSEKELDSSLEDESGFEDEDIADENEDGGDPDFQGTIRTVPGACLVYKRKENANTYEELWIYSTNERNIKYENEIRGSILAGTDVDPNTERSPDGDQRAKTTTVGNVQFVYITGLPN